MRLVTSAGYVRCYQRYRTFRAAGIRVLLAPARAGNDNVYGPKWAVALTDALISQGVRNSARIAQLKERASTEPDVPESVLNEIGRISGFAILRGWTHERGIWETHRP